MATYFEALNDNNKITLNDNNSFMYVTRWGGISKIADKSFSYYFKPIGYDSLYFSGSPAMTYAEVFIVNYKEGEIGVAVKPTVNSLHVGYTVFRSFDGFLSLLIYGTYGCSESEFFSFLDGLYIYVAGEKRVGHSGFGLELYNESGTLIYRSSDMLVDIIGAYSRNLDQYDIYVPGSYPYLNVIKVKENKYPRPIALGFSNSDMAVFVNSVSSCYTFVIWVQNAEFFGTTFYGFGMYNNTFYSIPVFIELSALNSMSIGGRAETVSVLASYTAYAFFMNVSAIY